MKMNNMLGLAYQMINGQSTVSHMYSVKERIMQTD